MDRFKAAKKASILGIVGNIFLLIIKAIVGFISHSQSMIADAFNSAGDIFSSIMTYIGNRISSKEADADHNLGHGKAEYIYSLLISITMIIMSITVIKGTIETFINKEKFVFSIWLVIVCIITIITKFSLYIYTHHLYKKYNNILIDANSKDHRNDCLVTTGTLISILFSLKGIFWVDKVVGIIISLWIAYSGIKLFIESYDVLMDKCMDNLTKDKVYEIIKKHKEVVKVNHFNTTPVGYQYQISFTIFVDGNLSTFESHDIANKLEREIEKKIPEIYLTVIHVNPIETKK
ncbi:MAG: cation transporter [Bacilli bacterium]|nr:cation transporter [Bacilli bacterium]